MKSAYKSVLIQKKLWTLSSAKIVVFFFFLIQFSFITIFSLTSNLPQALTIKLVFLSILLFLSLMKSDFLKLNKIDFSVYIFLIYGCASILWGDFSFENMLISIGFLLNFFLTYSIIRFCRHIQVSIKFFFLVWLLEAIHIWIVDSGVVGGAYLFGHTSIAIFLVLAYSRSVNGWLNTPYLVSLGLLSGLRFFGLVILCFFPYLINVFILLLGVPLLYVLSSIYLTPGSEYYSLGLGYRVSEIPLLLEFLGSSDLSQLLFGDGAGGGSEIRNLGSKGWIEHKNWFHNFFISVIFNFGLLGFILVVAPLFLVRGLDPRKLSVLLAVYIMLCIDTHRDGAWLLFLAFGLIGKDFEHTT